MSTQEMLEYPFRMSITWAFRIAAVLLFFGALATLTMTRQPIKPQHA